MSWRFVNASVRGTSHETGDLPCQDDCLVDVVLTDADGVVVAITSDGAGSAACADEGASLACETLLSAVERWLRGGESVAALTRDAAEQWIEEIRRAISNRAAQKNLAARDFACTVAAAVVAREAAVFLQIGDGAIVAATGDAYDVIFWPDAGEYANMTYFVTDADWAAHLHFEVRHTAFDALALLTDGLQRLALQFETRTAHVPFFAPMFVALASAAPGFASELETPLVGFLQSEAVNSRTDDDKSLVLATRRSETADGAI